MGAETRPPVEMPPLRVVRKALLTFAFLTLVVGCLTVLFLGMRAVMEIGGTCASGGPYEIANPCPEGVAWMMVVSIWGGVIALGFYVGNAAGLPGPKWAALAWPALFLSLGWNFWEYGLDPPGVGAPDVAWGWIVCGVLFVLMGGVPLVAGLWGRTGWLVLFWSDAGGQPGERPDARRVARETVREAKPPLRVRDVRAAAAAARTPTPTGSAAAASAAGPAATDVADMAEDLERLAALHQSGSLTDSEFRAAKARRITGGAS